MKTVLSLAAVLAAAAVSAANAEFAPGNFVAINGVAGPQFGNPQWGTNAGQGLHQLGGVSNYFDSVSGPNYAIVVTSTVVNPYSVIFDINFSAFFPGDFSAVAFEIVGLKQDNTIVDVAGNSAGFQWDGNNVVWSGTGAELADLGTLSFKVFQIPAPGAIALVGLAGLAGGRRRRA